MAFHNESWINNLHVKSIQLIGQLSGQISIVANDATANYNLVLPNTAPTTNGQVLKVNDYGSGQLEWGGVISSSSLSSLTDTNISTPLVDQTILYTGSEWENKTVRKRIDLVNTETIPILNSVWTPIPFNIERKKDSLFVHTPNNSEIEFQSSDDYLIIINLILLVASGVDKSYQGRLEKSVNGGVWTNIEYSNLYGTSTTTISGNTTISLFESFNIGDKLRLTCLSISASTTFYTKSGGTMLTIVRL